MGRILGKNFNMAALAEANRHKRALGNANVNIGGDLLDEQGKVVKKAASIAYESHAAPVERTVESIADVMPVQEKQEDALEKQFNEDTGAFSDGADSNENLVEDEHGNFVPASELAAEKSKPAENKPEKKTSNKPPNKKTTTEAKAQ